MAEDFDQKVQRQIDAALRRERRTVRRRIVFAVSAMLVLSLPFAVAALPDRTFSTGEPITAADFQALWNAARVADAEPVVSATVGLDAPYEHAAVGNATLMLTEISITPSGRPVSLSLVSDRPGTESYLKLESADSTDHRRSFLVIFERAVTTEAEPAAGDWEAIATHRCGFEQDGVGSAATICSPGAFRHLDLDVPTADMGRVFYRIKVRNPDVVSPHLYLSNFRLVAWEGH